LIANGRRVTVLDNLSMGRREAVPDGARFIHGDIRDRAAVTEALAGVDGVVHLAAQVTIRGSFDRFYEDLDTNLMGTANIVRSIDPARVRWFTLASSMAVYSDCPAATPIAESHPTEPLSPYGVGKRAAEQVCQQMLAAAGVPLTVLRFFNTFGPGQSYTPYVGVITIFITRLLQSLPPVIFGDGEQRRDFVHVSDITDGVVGSLGRAPGMFNLGSGRQTSLNSLAHLLIDRLQPGTPPAREPARGGELRFSLADITAAQRAFGYSPSRRLEDSLDEVIADVRGRPNR
jgi:UDP-glucose 4-epimerase